MVKIKRAEVLNNHLFQEYGETFIHANYYLSIMETDTKKNLRHDDSTQYQFIRWRNRNDSIILYEQESINERSSIRISIDD